MNIFNKHINSLIQAGSIVLALLLINSVSYGQPVIDLETYSELPETFSPQPSLIPNIMIAIDTSGSMKEEESCRLELPLAQAVPSL